MISVEGHCFKIQRYWLLLWGFSFWHHQARSRLQIADRKGCDRGPQQPCQELVQRDPQVAGRQDRAVGHRRRQQERDRQAAQLLHEHFWPETGQPCPGENQESWTLRNWPKFFYILSSLQASKLPCALLWISVVEPNIEMITTSIVDQQTLTDIRTNRSKLVGSCKTKRNWLSKEELMVPSF